MNTKTLQEMEKPELIDRVADLESEIEHMGLQIESLRRQLYGKKTERYIEDGNEQLSLFKTESPMESEEEVPAEKKKQTITYTRTVSGKKETKDLSHLPKLYEDYDVADSEKTCPCCQKTRPFIGYDEQAYLHYVPAILEVLVRRLAKYGKCPKCEACEPPILIAHAPRRLLPGTFVTEDVLAWICVSKVIDRMTLHPLEKQLDTRSRTPISRQTMARWMIAMAPKLQPLVNALKETIWDYDVMWVDATSFQVLKEKDKLPDSKSYAYCVIGGPPGKKAVIFEYSQNHHGFLKDFLLDWKGTLHCDALNCYDYLDDVENITLAFCNCHARRRFEEITKGKKKSPVAKQLMQLYKQFYKIERTGKENKLSPDQIKDLRQTEVKPIMEKMKTIIDSTLPVASISTRLQPALKYTYDHWSKLTTFLTDGRLDPDNNRTERMIKYFALSRKNFLFSDTVAGAMALTIHFSLLISAQQNGLEPLAYYTKILKEIPNCRPGHLEDYEKLLPWNVEL